LVAFNKILVGKKKKQSQGCRRGGNLLVYGQVEKKQRMINRAFCSRGRKKREDPLPRVKTANKRNAKYTDTKKNERGKKRI